MIEIDINIFHKSIVKIFLSGLSPVAYSFFQVNLVVCYNKITGSQRPHSYHQQRPLVRGMSRSTSSRSTSGSLKFSRSSGSWRCISKSTNTSTSVRQNIIPMKTVRSLVETMHSSIDSDAYMTASDSGSPNSPHGDIDDNKTGSRKRREIFNYTLSIPTTINEESRSVSRSPSPTPTVERLGMLQTLVEENSKDKLSVSVAMGEDDLSDTNTDDSGKGSFAMEELPVLPQAHCLIPTVIVTDGLSNSPSCSKTNSALYEEAVRILPPEQQHSDDKLPDSHDLQMMLIGDQASPVQVMVSDTYEE